MNDSLFCPLIAAGVASVFCLDTKGTKSSRKNDASTAQGKTPGPPFFHPHRAGIVVHFVFILFSENLTEY